MGNKHRYNRFKRRQKLRRVMKLLPFIFVLSLFVVMCFILSPSNNTTESNETVTLTDVMNSGRDADIEAILSTMTLEEKVGQMFMGCFYNGTPTPNVVQKYKLGGVLLFGASFEDTSKKALMGSIRAISYSGNISPLIAVDEEGGDVVRVSAYKQYRKTPFPSPRKLFNKGGMDALISDAHTKNKLLTDLGINMNLAPVCDISQNRDDFMYSRSLGQDAETTSEYVTSIVKACREDGIACSLKHFPGYGNSSDTHKNLSADNRPLDALRARDLLPFQAGINEGAPSVLVSHNIVTSIDDNLPASLSPAVHKLLRQEMSFDGIIITDDLSMGAVTKFSSKSESAVYAVLAGNDMLCTGDYAKQYKAVLKAVNDGVISEERIDNSVRRILRLKKEMDLIS